MTTNELKAYLYSLSLGEWPVTLEVDHETYANVCQSVLNWAVADRNKYFNWEGLEDRVSVAIGKHNGIMFKNVELILRKS
jgi:hypothetical protein